MPQPPLSETDGFFYCPPFEDARITTPPSPFLFAPNGPLQQEAEAKGQSVSPPIYERERLERSFHGFVLRDDFAWLRAGNWQAVLRDPALLPKPIRAKIDAENLYADRLLAPLEPLKAKILSELKARLVEDEEDPPLHDGAFSYFTKYRPQGEYELLYRRARADGDLRGMVLPIDDSAHLLLDGDAEGESKDFFVLGPCTHSPCHRKLAWSCDERGSEYFTIRVRDIAKTLAEGKGSDDGDVLTNTDGAVVWLKDSSGFLYVSLNTHHRPDRVMLHRLGTGQDQDTLIYQEEDPGWFLDISSLGNGDYGAIELHDHDGNECWLVDLRAPLPHPRLVEKRARGLRYELDVRGQTLFILTNADGALDFKMMRAPLDNPQRAHWQAFLPERRGVYLEDFQLFQGHLVTAERMNALVHLVVRDLDSGDVHDIAHDEEAYALGLEETLEFDTAWMRFSVSSPARPLRMFDYNMATREKILVKEQVIPSGHNPDAYVVRRLHVDAHDDAKIPLTLLYHRDTALGDAPVLLYGYGAYGHALNAGFSKSAFSLVDRGFVHCIAHIRGGTDKGFGWYEDGKLANKANSFLDFIAAAEALVERGITRRGKIIIHGGSAGGMLMGAVANMAPYLFAGVVADVPFVDVLNTMLDDTLPLTPPEWLEWGNPLASKADFERIRAYAPYETVVAQTYPPMLVMAGLTDPRVTYWEPLKWVAKLRLYQTPRSGAVLLKTNTTVGHGGPGGRYDQLEEVAMVQAFALACVTPLADLLQTEGLA